MAVNNVSYTWKQFDSDIKEICKIIKEKYPRIKTIIGIPKGGLVPAVAIANNLNLNFYQSFSSIQTTFKRDDILVVDDICDTGKTFVSIEGINLFTTCSLVRKNNSSFKPDIVMHEFKEEEVGWVHFCWEPEDKEQKRDNTFGGNGV